MSEKGNRTITPRFGPAARIALLYVLFAGLWILFSDRLLELFVREAKLLSWLQTVKGWGFVAVSGAALYSILLREFRSRSLAEGSRRRSEESFRSLIQQATDGIFIIDPGGCFLDVNPSGLAMLGYDRQALINRQVADFVVEHDRPAVEKDFDEIRQGKAILQQRIVLRQDGSTLPVEVSARALTDGRIQAIVRDVSERAQAEKALQTWANIFQHIRMGVAVGDPLNMQLKMVNPAFAEMHGFTVDELISRPIADLFTPVAREELPEHIRLINETGHQTFESEHIRKDGTTFPVLVDVTAIKDEQGHLLYRVASVTDISERKRAEDSLRTHLDRLAALRKVDVAITSTLDLRVTFDVLLDQVITTLGVDAADVLVYNPKLQQLEFSAGKGFYTTLIQESTIPVGKGLAGRAAAENRSISVPSFHQSNLTFIRPELIDTEGFEAYYGVPLVAKGQVKGVLEIFHRSVLHNNPDWVGFLEALSIQAAIAIDNMKLYEDLQRYSQELATAYDATLTGWSRALELRDQETTGHSQRVTQLTIKLAEKMGIRDADLVHVRRGTLLHDIGKMGVPDRILLKTGPLTPEEWALMRMHPVYAFQMLSPIPFLRQALDIPYCHHERWDGSGYPRGLKGEQIPLPARIFAVVDVWDALRSDRPYRPAWSSERVQQYLRERAGKHFDPQVVDTFLAVLPEILEYLPINSNRAIKNGDDYAA